MRLRILIVTAALLALALSSRDARADTLLIPHAGVVFGGDLDDSVTTYGGTNANVGDGAFGFEVEGTYTPDFFGTEEDLLGDNNVSTLMASILLGSTFGSADEGRFYVALGGGLLKSRVEDVDQFFEVDSTDFGVNAGGGVIFLFGDRFGVRGDIRYFRNLADPEADDEFDVDFGDFSYWRGTGGLVFRF
jgi:hypothetical protein